MTRHLICESFSNNQSCYSLNHSLLSFGYEFIITFHILKRMIFVLAKILQTYVLTEDTHDYQVSFNEQSYQIMSVRDYQLVVKILSVLMIHTSTLRPVVLALYEYQ